MLGALIQTPKGEILVLVYGFQRIFGGEVQSRGALRFKPELKKT